MQDQLACWDQVREAGIALSRTITSLTWEHEQGTASSETLWILLPACFQHVRIRTEATFAKLNANLPSLLCRFVTPDQARHILASIFTCLCNYNTEICGMDMAQTVVPVYTIPNTHRVQQSLWESTCQITPGIACTSRSEPRPLQPIALRNMAAGQSGMVLGTRSSSELRTGTSGLGNPQSVTDSSTHEKGATQETYPVRIPPDGSKWAFLHQYMPTVDLTGNGDPPNTRPQEASTPITTTLAPERRLSRKKLNISKVKASHLLFDMQDWQERARKSAEAENQATVSKQTTGKECGSSAGLPHGLPVTLPNLVGGLPSVPSDPTPEAPQWSTKHPHDDNEITELPVEGELAGPPKKKKKKRNSKDTSKDDVPLLEGHDDGSRPGTSMAEPAVNAEEPSPVPAVSRVPEEEDMISKKKKKHKKKEAGLEKFQLEQREARAKEMAKAKHRSIQCEQDFRAIQKYRKSLPAEILETINGADHSDFLLKKLKKENNYMGQKSGHKRNLMTVTQLLSRITKYTEELTKHLREVQVIIKSTFLMVQGMPTADKCSPELVVWVLMDCAGNHIDCDHPEYGKEQNMGLYDVISLAAMARVTVRETHVVEGIPTTIKVDHAYCPFCAYTASNHWALNNHVRMHFRAIMVCGWPGCYFVHMQSLRMIEHSSKVHGMAQAKPCREKGQD